MLRIYLTAELCMAGGGHLIRAQAFPGRQGRLAFAYLVTERARSVPRPELAEALWPQQVPAASEVALSALASKLRMLLRHVGVAGTSLAAGDGSYRLELPPEAWVDTEAALESVHQAEGSLRAGLHPAAYGPAVVAAAILRRPFLAGIEGAWVDERRELFRRSRVRALDVLAEIHAANREVPLALQAAEEVLVLEPFRERGYRRLMRIHQLDGNGAEALRVYERCRQLLSAELGVSPEPETDALRDEVLSARRTVRD